MYVGVEVGGTVSDIEINIGEKYETCKEFR